MKEICLLVLLACVCAFSLIAEEKTKDVRFEIYTQESDQNIQVFLKVTNDGDSPYKMDQPRNGPGRNYFRYYRSGKDDRYGEFVDVLVPGSWASGPMITVLKGKPYHCKLYDLPKDLDVVMKVKYRLDSEKEIFTNEIEL